MSPISEPLTLPCGLALPNRICKPAMTERLTNADYRPNEQHFRLYQKWAAAGAGLLLTGNVMVTNQCMESAGNVVIQMGLSQKDEIAMDAALAKWAGICKEKGSKAIVQIGHSGRQTTKMVSLAPVSASDVAVKNVHGMCAKPRALTEAEINETIEDIAYAAEKCKKAGFDGVQLHAAHGYLISQFLSPLTNLRTDKWGGSLENRRRFLINAVRLVRTRCGPNFAVAVKLNSADFQRGGFAEHESIEVAKVLHEEGIDLLEISGGTYEAPAMFDMVNPGAETQKPAKGAPGPAKKPQRASTIAREAYFLDFAEKLRAAVPGLPLMVTGGLKTPEFINSAISSGKFEVAGIGRGLLMDSECYHKLLRGETPEEHALRSFNNADLELANQMGVWIIAVENIANGKPMDWSMSPWWAVQAMPNIELRKSIPKKRHMKIFTASVVASGVVGAVGTFLAVGAVASSLGF